MLLLTLPIRFTQLTIPHYSNGSSKSISNELYILPFIFLAFLYLRFYTLTFDLRRAQAETGRLKSELGILRRERARDHQIRVHLEQNGVGAKPKEEEEARAALGLRKAVRSPGDEAVMEELKRKLALSSISGPGSGSGSTIRLGSSNENGSGDRSQVQTWGMPRKRVVAQDIWVPGALSKTSL